eukprot:PhM_4_TR10594/c0_g3_i1/m.67588
MVTRHISSYSLSALIGVATSHSTPRIITHKQQSAAVLLCSTQDNNDSSSTGVASSSSAPASSRAKTDPTRPSPSNKAWWGADERGSGRGGGGSGGGGGSSGAGHGGGGSGGAGSGGSRGNGSSGGVAIRDICHELVALGTAKRTLTPVQSTALCGSVVGASILSRRHEAWRQQLSYAVREFMFRADWVSAVRVLPLTVDVDLSGYEAHWMPVAIRNIGYVNWRAAINAFLFVHGKRREAIRGHLYNGVMKVLGARWTLVLACYHQMVQVDKFAPDCHTIEAVVASLAMNSRWYDAVRIASHFYRQEMSERTRRRGNNNNNSKPSSPPTHRERELPPLTLKTFEFLVRSIASHVDEAADPSPWFCALNTLAQMRRDHPQFTTIACNAAIKALAAAGRWLQAVALSARFEAKRVQRDAATWSLVLMALNRSRLWSRALDLAQRHPPLWLSSEHSVLHILTAVRNARHSWELGLTAFGSVPCHQMKRRDHMYAAVVAAMRRTLQWEAMLRVYHRMVTQSYARDPVPLSMMEDVVTTLHHAQKWELCLRVAARARLQCRRSDELEAVDLSLMPHCLGVLTRCGLRHQLMDLVTCPSLHGGGVSATLWRQALTQFAHHGFWEGALGAFTVLPLTHTTRHDIDVVLQCLASAQSRHPLLTDRIVTAATSVFWQRYLTVGGTAQLDPLDLSVLHVVLSLWARTSTRHVAEITRLHEEVFLPHVRKAKGVVSSHAATLFTLIIEAVARTDYGSPRTSEGDTEKEDTVWQLYDRSVEVAAQAMNVSKSETTERRLAACLHSGLVLGGFYELAAHILDTDMAGDFIGVSGRIECYSKAKQWKAAAFVFARAAASATPTHSHATTTPAAMAAFLECLCDAEQWSSALAARRLHARATRAASPELHLATLRTLRHSGDWVSALRYHANVMVPSGVYTTTDNFSYRRRCLMELLSVLVTSRKEEEYTDKVLQHFPPTTFSEYWHVAAMILSIRMDPQIQ